MKYPRFECQRCHWKGEQRDIDFRTVFPGSLEEPEETIGHCPQCGDTELEPLCVMCDYELVDLPDEHCDECRLILRNGG